MTKDSTTLLAEQMHRDLSEMAGRPLTTLPQDRPSSITNPGDGAWNCCTDKPAGVISFDDGTAVLACAHCLSTVSSSRRHPLPNRPTYRPEVVRSHGLADYEQLRTSTVRSLAGAKRLLADALHAHQDGRTEVVQEFLERVLASVTKEETFVRNARPCSDRCCTGVTVEDESAQHLAWVVGQADSPFVDDTTTR